MPDVFVDTKQLVSQTLKMKAERDAAIELAEEMARKMREEREEMEQVTQKGYEEAFTMLQNEKAKTEAAEATGEGLKEQIEKLKEQNARLLAAAGIDKKYADMVDAESQNKETAMFQEYEEKCKQQRNFITSKVDAFLKTQCEHLEEYLAFQTVKEMMEKGGEALVREALGEEGVQIMKEQLNKVEDEESRAAKRIEEAKKVRADMVKKVAQQKAKKKTPISDTWTSTGYITKTPEHYPKKSTQRHMTMIGDDQEGVNAEEDVLEEVMKRAEDLMKKWDQDKVVAGPTGE